MKVYVVYKSIPWENGCILRICSTKDEAVEYVKNITKRDWDYFDLGYEAVKVDADIEELWL